MDISQRMQQTLALTLYRSHHARMTMTHGSGAKSGSEVHIAVAIAVNYVGSARLRPHDRIMEGTAGFSASRASRRERRALRRRQGGQQAIALPAGQG